MTVDVPLRDHLEAMISALDLRFTELRLADGKATVEYRQSAMTRLGEQAEASKEAIGKALAAASDAASKADAVTERRLVEAKEDLEHRLDALNNLKADMATKADLQVVIADVRAVRDLITKLESRVDKGEAAASGRATGLKDHIAWILFALSVVGSLIGFAVMLRR